MNYEFSAIEAKWHKYWEENDTFHTDVWDFSKPKYYALERLWADAETVDISNIIIEE